MLKLMFPTLAKWPGEKLALLPVSIAWLVLVLAALVHYLIWPDTLPNIY